MYYSSGNYEALARPRAPRGVADKSAWFVGAGLASLAGAAFLIRDGHLPGDRVTVLERGRLAGGALGEIEEPGKGFVVRGPVEVDEHSECLWDLFASVPSIEADQASVLDEFYWLNKDQPNRSLRRTTIGRGDDTLTGGRFAMGRQARRELLEVFLAAPEDMENRRIDDVFGPEFRTGNFWLYWRTTFGFQDWHSALEFKTHLHRFVHRIGALPDFAAAKTTRFNHYESLILPLYRWLIEQGVRFRFGTEVTDIDFELAPDRRRATALHWLADDAEGGTALGPDDLLFVTLGAVAEHRDCGDHDTPAAPTTAPAWPLWRRIARKDPAFGDPDVFGGDVAATTAMTATVTTLDARIPGRVRRICEREPFGGGVVSGGPVTVVDSAWMLSWSVDRQPHFRRQLPGQMVVGLQALRSDVPGDHVRIPMRECTGEQITREWLYHLGVPVERIDRLAAESARCVPVLSPYATACFMPRQAGDRPPVVPRGAVNFAFLGQFAETPREGAQTAEYSVRTAMEAVYHLLGLERGVPEVFDSTFDVRALLAAVGSVRDGAVLPLPGPDMLRRRLAGRLGATGIGRLLDEFGLLPPGRDVAEAPRPAWARQAGASRTKGA